MTQELNKIFTEYYEQLNKKEIDNLHSIYMNLLFDINIELNKKDKTMLDGKIFCEKIIEGFIFGQIHTEYTQFFRGLVKCVDGFSKESIKIIIKHCKKLPGKIKKLLVIQKPKYRKKRIPSCLRFKVWDKFIGKTTEGVCLCCKTQRISIANFDCGHIISEKNGGKGHLDNLKPICRNCNLSMGTTNMNDFKKDCGL